ncbi:MAG: hypothetical protein H7196_03070, partial [candidate division SR1 bacterium]|nr:hypothetical protein [candidate division SR1 bacterium]
MPNKPKTNQIISSRLFKKKVFVRVSSFIVMALLFGVTCFQLLNTLKNVIPSKPALANNCPAGYTWNGTQCEQRTVKVSGTPICPSGYTDDGGNPPCIATTARTPICPSGWVYNSGLDKCESRVNKVSNTSYSCPSGGSLSGSTCNVNMGGIYYAPYQTANCDSNHYSVKYITTLYNNPNYDEYYCIPNSLPDFQTRQGSSCDANHYLVPNVGQNTLYMCAPNIYPGLISANFSLINYPNKGCDSNYYNPIYPVVASFCVPNNVAYSATANTTTSCPNGYTEDTNTPPCYALQPATYSCPSGYSYNSNTILCEQRTAKIAVPLVCPSGYTDDGGNPPCVRYIAEVICGLSQYFNTTSYSCVDIKILVAPSTSNPYTLIATCDTATVESTTICRFDLPPDTTITGSNLTLRVDILDANNQALGGGTCNQNGIDYNKTINVTCGGVPTGKVLGSNYIYFYLTGSIVSYGSSTLTTISSAFSKIGKDSTTNSTTSTVPGNTIDWTLAFNNGTGSIQPTVDITDTVPSGTELVAGSLKVPPNFTANYSTDSGTSYSTTEPTPTSNTTSIKASGVNIPNDTNGQVQGFGPVLTTLANTSTGGDGTFPIPFEHSTGSRVYTIYHHQQQEKAFNINCIVVSSSSICPGYPKYFSTTNSSDNTGPHDISTSWTNFTETVGNKVFYAAQTDASNGIGCFDMEAGRNCGYYQLGILPRVPAGANPANIQFYSSQTGLVRSGDKLYTVGNDVQFYCLNITSLTPCASQPYNLATASNPGVGNNSYGQSTSPIFTTNGKIYHAQNYDSTDANFNRSGVNANTKISCFDPSTNVACTSFSLIDVPNSVNWFESPGTFSWVSSLYPIQNSINQITGICTTGRLEVTGNTFCFNKDTGASIAIPPIFTNLPASTISTNLSYTVLFRNTAIRNKIYIPLYGVGYIVEPDTTSNNRKSGAVVCFDFDTNARCAGFGNDGFVEPYTQGVSINNGADGPRTYGFSYFNGCMLGLGDAGILWSFNPDTGATPCTTSSASTVIKPSGYYCDGQSHTITWSKSNVVDTFSTTGLNDIITKVYDKNGIFLKQGSVLSTFSLSISDIPYGNSVSYNSLTGLDTTEIQVETTGYGTTSGLANLVGKRTVTSFNGDYPQVCFKTKINSAYKAAILANTANITNISPNIASFGISVIRPFDPANDLPILTNLTGLTCNPSSVLSSSTTTCSGTFPSNVTAPSS